MVFYTNYRQVAKITLKSEKAVKELVANVIVGHETGPTGEYADPGTGNPRVYLPLPGVVINVVKKYTFNVELPHMQFGKNTRLAVDSFTIIYPSKGNTETYVNKDITDVYIKNLHRKNVYHSTSKSSNGTCILSLPLVPELDKVNSDMYQNHDIINNSIDITGSTAFLQGQPLEIFVDTTLAKYKRSQHTVAATHVRTTKFPDDGVIDGCPEAFKWSLSLIIYEEEKEENNRDYVDDRVKPHSIPALY